MANLWCRIFGHIPINKKEVYRSENNNPVKEWATHQATCKRCGCNLVALEQYGEFSKETVTSKYIKI